MVIAGIDDKNIDDTALVLGASQSQRLSRFLDNTT
jgi:hypothetical protein